MNNLILNIFYSCTQYWIVCWTIWDFSGSQYAWSDTFLFATFITTFEIYCQMAWGMLQIFWESTKGWFIKYGTNQKYAIMFYKMYNFNANRETLYLSTYFFVLYFDCHKNDNFHIFFTMFSYRWSWQQRSLVRTSSIWRKSSVPGWWFSSCPLHQEPHKGGWRRLHLQVQ